jgi:hypothetical protein
MKHLKQALETLAKTPKKILETIINIDNIQIKHLHHICENICNIQINILVTYVGKKQMKH